MKVVGFKEFKKNRKEKKHRIVCISHFFRNASIVLGTLIFLMVFSLVNTNFSLSLKECLQNFIGAMGKLLI